MIQPTNRLQTPLSLAGLSLLFSLSLLRAETERDTLTSITGIASLPQEISADINSEGLSLKDVIVTIHGKYNHPRMPYPENWSDLTPEQRRGWRDEFTKSDAHDLYQKKVEAARSKRFAATATLAEDGTFTFTDIVPSWYSVNVLIMHPKAEGEPTYELARGHALRQFIIKDGSRPHNLGKITLKLKNVLMPGDKAPDFTVTGYDGAKFKLSDFRGKYVLFDFWATWCGPCIAQIPNLEAASEKFGGDRFEVIGLSVDKTIDKPGDYLKENPSHYTQGYVAPKDYLPTSTAYGLQSIPSIWLISPDGKILARDLRGELIEQEVGKALTN